MDTLERLARILKKNLINIKKVQEIKDDIEFYVDNNDKADFPENLDNLDVFDELEMEKYDSTATGCKKYKNWNLLDIIKILTNFFFKIFSFSNNL